MVSLIKWRGTQVAIEIICEEWRGIDKQETNLHHFVSAVGNEDVIVGYEKWLNAGDLNIMAPCKWLDSARCSLTPQARSTSNISRTIMLTVQELEMLQRNIESNELGTHTVCKISTWMHPIKLISSVTLTAHLSLRMTKQRLGHERRATNRQGTADTKIISPPGPKRRRHVRWGNHLRGTLVQNEQP